METSTGDFGRLGNQIIRNIAVSFIATKHNLYVNYYNYELIKELGIELFIGDMRYNRATQLTDDNYFLIYNRSQLKKNLDPRQSFFQTKPIMDLIYNHLHTDIVKKNIIEKNIFKERYNANNDLFIHIRLTDVADTNPGVSYYLNIIKTINYDNLYIASDDTSHDIIKEIQKQYPNTNIVKYDEIRTIQFGSTCKNIILSYGTFSAIIGYLAFYSNVHYPEYIENKIWHGDIFSIQKWNRHKL